MSSPRVLRELSPYLLAFLHGTIDSKSPLMKLRGHGQVLRTIWEIVCEEWMALHVDYFPVDSTFLRIPELLPWDVNHYASHLYPTARQECAGCPVVVLEQDIPFPELKSIPKGRFQHQSSNDLYVNMMPFDLQQEKSLPLECRQYWCLVAKCTRMINFNEPGHAGRYIGYLTIDERSVPSGTSQRRAGLHVESTGVMPLIQSDVDTLKAPYRLRATNGTYIPGVEGHWGSGLLLRNEYVDGGIFMASNIADTTAVWNCRINDEDGDFIGPHGDIERFRPFLGPCARTLEAGELIWMTDRTPHESLPIPASAGSQRRQYFRLVVGQVSAWFADHSTPNPLGTVPPPDVRIIKGDKFSLYPSPTRSWHCGTKKQIREIILFKRLQERMNLFGVGHLSQRAFDYGLTSPVELIRVFKQQGGLPRGGNVDWTKRYSKDKQTELFEGVGGHSYDKERFYDMVCSFEKLMITVPL